MRSKPLTRWHLAVFLAAQLCALACGGGTATTPFPGAAAEAASPAPGEQVRRVRADDVVESLAESLETGHRSTVGALRGAQLSEVIDDIVRVDGFQTYDLSADALVGEVYRRAEAHTAGQGERVLAYLYNSVAADNGAVAVDPAFDALRQVAQMAPSGSLDPARFRFAPAETARGIVLPAHLDRAVNQLAYVYAQPNLSQLRTLTARTFRKPGFNFDSIVAQSSNSRDAIRRMVVAGTPPPAAEVALESIMRASIESNGALRAEAEFVRSIEELRSELGLERLDPELRAYASAEDLIPSRQAQLAEAKRVSMRGKVSRPRDADILAIARETATGRVVDEPARSRAAQQFVDYVTTSFEPSADDASAAGSFGGGGGHVGGGDAGGGGGNVGGGAGGGGGSGSGRRPAYNGERPYRTSTPRPSSSSSSGGGLSRVSRVFSSAARSARAARGVAAGANVSHAIPEAPVAAAWVPIREDGRFGRLVVRFTSAGGTRMASSRTVFADSFYAAVSVLWGGHTGATAFREGEILVLMSMDPFAELDTPLGRELEQRRAALAERAESVQDTDVEARRALVRDFIALQIQAASLPRRTVFHPALFGRELAWSAVRIDFSFNDLPKLSRESALINGGRPMPVSWRGMDVSDAQTWQFYERDSVVQMATTSPTAGRLTVMSSGPQSTDPSSRSHFAVSMFALTDDDEEGKRLPELEGKIQPMLDWLSTNHHDFMRLNDFSESLTLLRWLRGNKIAPILIDLDGEDPEIATPDRIVIGEGPKVR